MGVVGGHILHADVFSRRRVDSLSAEMGNLSSFGRGVHDNSCLVPSDNSGRPSVAGESFAALCGLPLHVFASKGSWKSLVTRVEHETVELYAHGVWRSRLIEHVNRKERASLIFVPIQRRHHPLHQF